MITLANEKKPELEHLDVRGPITTKSRQWVKPTISAELETATTGYSRMQATNPHSGKREDVILLPPEKIAGMSELLADSHLELRTDLNSAFAEFTKVQRRVLHNVLIRGMSIEIATARMNKSSRWWRRWMTDEALPALRAKLADYQEYVTRDIRLGPDNAICGCESTKEVVVR